MSLRIKSLFVAFGISIALWGVMIKSASALYSADSASQHVAAVSLVAADRSID